MIALVVWQALLDALGWVVAWIYGLISNYGLTIIVLTVLVRLVLLPLGIKQIRSMQHMQIVQPKIKQLQQKYKQNKQKQQEEIMKLYKEYGVNPFSGCWPMLLQFPILIAMYSVLRWPQSPVHIPEGSELYNTIQLQIPEPPTAENLAKLPGPPEGTSFLGMNLLCTPLNAGRPGAELTGTADGQKVSYPVDCGEKAIDRIPYYALAILMFATTYYQQRQMQKASPPGAASQQQQNIMKIMPIMFGVFGLIFPAGLAVYWTTSNLWTIGQQYYILRTRPTEEALAERAAQSQKKEKKGFMSSMMERAQDEQKRRRGPTGQAKPLPKRPPSSKPPRGGNPPGKGSGQPRAKPTKPKKPTPPTNPPAQDDDGTGSDQRADD